MLTTDKKSEHVERAVAEMSRIDLRLSTNEVKRLQGSQGKICHDAAPPMWIDCFVPAVLLFASDGR